MVRWKAKAEKIAFELFLCSSIIKGMYHGNVAKNRDKEKSKNS